MLFINFVARLIIKETQNGLLLVFITYKSFTHLTMIAKIHVTAGTFTFYSRTGSTSSSNNGVTTIGGRTPVNKKYYINFMFSVEKVNFLYHLVSGSAIRTRRTIKSSYLAIVWGEDFSMS